IMSYVPIPSEASLLNRGFDHERTSVHDLKSWTKTNSSPRSGRIKTQSRVREHSNRYPIVVHCHLCWDWVWQRPQQFLSRLSKTHRILFVETRAPDPALVTPLARYETLENFPNLTLLRFQFPSSRWQEGA